MDNTLISFGERLPSIDVVNFINNVKKMGIEFVLFSNNIKSRVENFAKKAGIDNYFWDCRKPLIGKMKIIDNLFNFNRDEMIFIGDQLITDIFFANRCHIKSILVTPLKRSEDENKFIKFLENKILKKLEQKNIIHEGFYTDSELTESYEIL
ncbi:YqeG family HAD IIIA-type phosphatase [Spiroplasma endosymbiont of Crioceris asparagi]|uniref:YqeG family HAD IIIA-type phosphatase n=1 Tax=Spiroplasma endosymbiont of Crioceris asparagi TaxID=3066286 RepID=UPI0030D526A9